MDKKDTIVKKEVESEENEEIKQLYNDALALESKVQGYLENEEFIKDKENTGKLMTVTMICSRIESAVMKVVKKDFFKPFTDKLDGGEKDGE